MKRNKSLLLEPLETRSLFAADLQEFMPFNASYDHACDVEVSNDRTNDFFSNRSIAGQFEQTDFSDQTRRDSLYRSNRSEVSHARYADDFHDSSSKIANTNQSKHNFVFAVEPPSVKSAFQFIDLSSDLHFESLKPNLVVPTVLPTTFTLLHLPSVVANTTIPTIFIIENSPTSNNAASSNAATGNALSNRSNDFRPTQRISIASNASQNIAPALSTQSIENSAENAQIINGRTNSSTALGNDGNSSTDLSEAPSNAATTQTDLLRISADRQRAFAIYGIREIAMHPENDMLALEWLESSSEGIQTSEDYIQNGTELSAFNEYENDLTNFTFRKQSHLQPYAQSKGSARLSPSSSDRYLIPADMVFLEMNDTSRHGSPEAVAALDQRENQEIVLQAGLSPIAIYQIFLQEAPSLMSGPLDLSNLDFTLNADWNKSIEKETESSTSQLVSLSGIGVAVATTLTLIGITNHIREYKRRLQTQAILELYDHSRSEFPFSEKFPK